MKALEIADKLAAIIEAVRDNHGEIDDHLFNELQHWRAELAEKAHNIALVQARFDADIAYLKTIEDAARDRRKVVEASKDRLKKYLAVCMQQGDVKQVKGDLFTVSLVQGRVKTVIENPEALPMQYIDIVEVVKPKNAEIKQALEAGEVVEGAHLERGEDYVMIRGGRKDETDA